MAAVDDSVVLARQDELPAFARPSFSQFALREGNQYHQREDAVEPWTNLVKLGGAHNINDVHRQHPLDPHVHAYQLTSDVTTAHKYASDAATTEHTVIESEESFLSEGQQEDAAISGKTLLGKHTYAKRCKPRLAAQKAVEEGSCINH